MKRTIQLAIVLAVVGTVSIAGGHGHTINVTTANNRLVVTGGTLNVVNGYTDQVFVETDSSGDPQDFADFSNFGPGIYWIVPGFSISGLAENSGLYLQTISRPVRNTDPIDSRVLWYWDPNSAATNKVEVAPDSSRMQIRQNATVNTLLTPPMSVAPTQMKIAAPVAADMHPDNHDLLKYVMPAPLPPDGAYAFFARLTSDVYGPSNPFLVVINNGGLEGPSMLSAAAAIDQDALLAGDYNHDDRVDAADYLAWRKTLGSMSQLAADGSNNQLVDIADYNIWRSNFGHVFSPGGALGSAMIPEPTGSCLLLCGSLVSAIGWRDRRRGAQRRG